MAITSTRAMVGIKEKGHFEHDDERMEKYTLADELPAKLSELRLLPRSMATAPAHAPPAPPACFTVRRLTAADREPILQFLRRFFFRDEPMNKAVSLLATPDARCIELEEYTASTLDDEVSVAAVDDSGEFVGVVVNGLVTRMGALEAEASGDKSEECPNPKFRRILRVLSHLEREADIWAKVPADCEQILEVRIASTHTAWRGRGLMRALCEEAERLGKEKGATACRMDTTSAFSAAAAERLGYKKVYGAMYAELPVPDAPVPEPPHLEASTYIKLI